ncbi:hypothetical protein Bca4012_038739 [Brassica carinata]
MEMSQEHNFFNPTNQNLDSKPEAEAPIPRLSSSSSSSSCSSIEAEPRPNNDNNVDQSPPTQIMERSTNDDTTTTTSSTPTYRIPSHVFGRTTSTAPVEWSTLSNESLFSIRMGNNSFTEIDYFKSGELTFPQPPSPRTPHMPSPPHGTNQGGGVMEEAKSPVDVGKQAAEADKAYRASKDEEQKAAASIREVIMANEASNKDNNNKNNKLDRSVSRRSEDLSVKSFAFQKLGNADKGGLQGSTPQKRRTSQPESPTSSSEAEGDEAHKPLTPRAEADCACNRNPRWLSCFPCCTTFCV